jgi:hypothetical protein
MFHADETFISCTLSFLELKFHGAEVLSTSDGRIDGKSRMCPPGTTGIAKLLVRLRLVERRPSTGIVERI